MAPFLEVKNLTHIYSKGTPFEHKALDGVSFGVERGEFIGVIGHTGSGKSTLVSLLNGISKPTGGRVLLDGKDIWENPKEIGKIRYRVGLVMQYPEYQLFDETVRLDIGYALRNQGLPESEIALRVEEAAKFTGIDEEMLEKSPFELSGGQKRRVAIAGIMAMKPEVLVLDEPAAGLDPEGRCNIFDAIEEYRRTENATVIIVSHSMEDMAERCDNIAVLYNSKLIASGSVSSVFSSPEILLKAGLDVPEVTRISMILAENGVKVDRPIYTLQHAVDFIMNKLSGGESR